MVVIVLRGERGIVSGVDGGSGGSAVEIGANAATCICSSGG